MGQKYTPMMEQYLEIKKDYADSLVFFRLGDFYELFFEDAITASKELEIALTARDAGAKDRVPMCGVPYHSVTPYIQKVINKGYKVAIVEQVTEPGNGLVERKVVKLITPGMIVDDGILDQKTSNYIGGISQERLFFSLSYADISTGEIYLTNPLSETQLYKEIEKLNLKEVVLTSDLGHVEKKLKGLVLVSIHDTLVENHPLLDNLDGIKKRSVGLLLGYLSKIEVRMLDAFTTLKISQEQTHLKLDKNSISALELTSSNHPKDHSLFKLLDKNQTAMGSRLLKNQIENPLTDINQINERLNYVEALNQNYNQRINLTEAFKGVYDLKRITSRIASLNSSPKDLSQLKLTLSKIPYIIEALLAYHSDNLTKYAQEINPHTLLFETLDKAVVNDPPLIIKDGGIFKKGYHAELDELRDAEKHGKKWIATFESEEREKTGIKNLKVGFNRVFGYYIEITKGNLNLVKDEFGYIRKQTLVNSERFINEALKEKEALILNASERSIELEYELFIELRELVSNYANSLQILADKIAFLDMMLAFSIIATENHYVRPLLREDKEVYIEGGRHPMVEHFNNTPFIENDISIIEGGILLITGPNMSGKSTYMRMFAIIVVMAQIGSFVPAKIAKLPIYDGIYTRIGAQDDLTSGQSTFMVEMTETNEALRSATANSLLIFDEIGRGTATYDGMALAQGIIEFVHEKVKAVMMFSTHYHELTQLEAALKRLKNIHVSAVLDKGSLVFMHKVKEGPTDKSYGINVAALAKLPKPLINRSQMILDHLEVDKKKEMDLNIFNFEEDEAAPIVDHANAFVANKIKELDIDSLTPIEALLLLKKYQDELK